MLVIMIYSYRPKLQLLSNKKERLELFERKWKFYCFIDAFSNTIWINNGIFIYRKSCWQKRKENFQKTPISIDCLHLVTYSNYPSNLFSMIIAPEIPNCNRFNNILWRGEQDRLLVASCGWGEELCGTFFLLCSRRRNFDGIGEELTKTCIVIVRWRERERETGWVLDVTFGENNGTFTVQGKRV